MNKKYIIQETEKFMRKNIPKSRLTGSDSGASYLRHILGARKYALLLAKKYKADKFVVEMAALLHDVGSDAGKKHAEESGKIAKVFMSKFDIPMDIKEKIISCIEKHSMGSKIGTIEEQIIQDADGIIFIEDTFKFYLEWGIEHHSAKDAKKFAIEKTKGMMNKIKTKEGIKLANNFLNGSLKYIENF